MKISQQKGYSSVPISKDEKKYLNLVTQELRIRISRKGHYLLRLPKFKNRKNYKQPLIKLFQIQNSFQWFGKLPNSDDLIYLKKENSNFNLYIFKEQWKYRFILLNLLSENTYNLINNNLIQLPQNGNNL